MKTVINFVGQFLSWVFAIIGFGIITHILAILFMYGWNLASI